MTNLADGLGTANLNILETGSISVLVAGSQQIGSTEIASGAVLPYHCGSGIALVKTGSPTESVAAFIQYGTGTLSADSGLWVVFGSPFLAAPTVLVTNSKTVAKTVNVAAGSVTVGSFFAEGETAADTITWIAIGTR
jgi:hypothetical protein